MVSVSCLSGEFNCPGPSGLSFDENAGVRYERAKSKYKTAP
jgi:hypothetical protein